MFVITMKREIVISLIIGVAAAAGSLLLTRQCASPEKRIVTREHIRIDTLRLAPDTIVLPGTLTVAPLPVADQSHRILRDSLALLRERLDCTLESLAALATLSVRGDSVLERSASLYRGGAVHALAFQDTLHVEYAFPPESRFRISHGSVALNLPPDTVVSLQYESRPWWVDLAIGVAGAVAAWLAGQAK